MEKNYKYGNINKINNVFKALSRSKFRSNFHLNNKEKEYINDKGINIIEKHAYELIGKRLAPDIILNDGRQTPMKGHPVFIAQHATATCCRECLYKWHKIKPGHEFSKEELDYVVLVIMTWIKNEMKI